MHDELGAPVAPRLAALAISLATLGNRHIGAAIGTNLSDEELHRLVAVAEHHRLLGALVEAVETGSMNVTDTQLDHIRARHRFWCINVLKVERLLMQVTDCFESRGIDSHVLKGVALAHSVYFDPSWRVFADVDLLVPPGQTDQAVGLVSTQLDGRRTVAELRPGFDRQFGKEAMLRVREMELDLHRTLVSGPFGLTIDLDELNADSASVQIGGRSVATLGPTSRYLSACYNIALGDYPVRLGAVRDLLLIDRLGGVDAVAIADAARRWRATAVIQRAGTIMGRVLGDDLSPTLRYLAALGVPAIERLALRTYLTPSRSYRRQVASLLVIRGVRPRLRYLWALAAPSREYLDSRGWTGTGHVRRGVRRLAGRTDG